MLSQNTKSLPPCLRPEHGDDGWSAPLDIYDLATRLESGGVTDAVAASEYGFSSTLDMAEASFAKTQCQTRKEEIVSPARAEWREHLAGMSFALPLLLSCLSMVLMGFSLWGGNLSAGSAAAVGVGAIGSFVVSGGFIQAMARRGLFYLSTGQPHRCADSVWRWCRVAVLFVVGVALAGMAVNEYFGWFPRELAAVVATFMVVLALFFIPTGILYMLDRNLLVAAGACVGIVVVGVGQVGLHLPLLRAEVIGLGAAAAFAFVTSAWLLQRAAPGKPEIPERESFGRGLYLLWPYFAYGFMYYAFLFADRFLAWTAHTDAAALPVEFRGVYEQASMIGLFAFMLQVGWVHASTVVFYRKLAQAQRLFGIADLGGFNHRMRSFYNRRLGLFLPIAVVSTASVWMIARSLRSLNDALTVHTTMWALAGMPLIIIGLWNASLLFGLSRPVEVLKCITWGTICNISVGYVLSRLLTYEQAMVGFTLGAAVFAILSTRYTTIAFSRLDYHYFRCQ